ncbi:tRNA pseudouridine synthase B [Salsuginibacillus halophilus]|uniref:tRNA pseudouridine synthase B n=1 Tax=Salsuginibacillus halophilus TaxID=517424 RepID=A0A2P8HYJ7_9BACI|nr:tRNA pseudouridine(55) synthase TruB [Salsuginibacillus halophilus]PSL51234.1 tRNA pseudouridine synthase B [Salsuginibacillus halophilus]
MTLTGILPLYKPKGVTSHDCVMMARRWLRTKKVGHTGTLDPEVTGVLVLCTGRATKVAEELTGWDKTYEAVVALGKSTTTEDAEGEVVEENQEALQRIREQDIDEALQTFTGLIEQVPPMYSAVKVNGRRLYEYARAGETVERPKRSVTIQNMERLTPVSEDENGKYFRIRLTCSKGTFVRTVAVDIGRYLGVPAHMAQLERTASGPFTTADCVTTEDMDQTEKPGQRLLPVTDALQHLPAVALNETTAKQIGHGAVLDKATLNTDQDKVLLTYKGEAMAVYATHPKQQSRLKPAIMIDPELPGRA